ncbi:hypothetical protein H4Q26_018381 [Puccinia striiformis f. sp. tritici PST-130]|nr:hypothetical protein H4Q26_018381 [Puccinia striiformis f. sp. tritici PST-130]
MPSHLRNGRDLSGEQRRRDVEAGLSNMPDKGPFNALRESLPSLEPTRTTRRETNVGVTPMEVNSRATSLALRSGMSTPVPIPVDRLTVPPKDPSNLRQQTTGDVHKYVPLPVVHVRRSQKTDDQVVMKAALNQAISSQELIRRVLSYEEMMDVCENWLAEAEMDIVFPKKRVSNPLISSATQASTSTPSHQKGRSSPQEILIDLISPPDHSQLGVRTGSKLRAESRSSSRPARDERVELREPECDERSSSELHAKCDERPSPELCAGRDERPCSELRAELRDAVQQNHNQSTFEHPRPPQHQQGLPATSHQAGPPPTTVRTIRTTVLEGTGTITAATNQQHPSLILLRSSAPPLTLFNASQVETQGDPGEKEESPTGRQHGSSLGSGKCLLESRKDLREDAKSPGKSECSKQESPKSTSSPVDPYMNLSFNPALEQLSDASQKNSCYLILTID